MSPPPPTKNCARLCKMVEFIVLSIKFVFMVLCVSYSRDLAERPTGCCSASGVLFSVCICDHMQTGIVLYRWNDAVIGRSLICV